MIGSDIAVCRQKMEMYHHMTIDHSNSEGAMPLPPSFFSTTEFLTFSRLTTNLQHHGGSDASVNGDHLHTCYRGSFLPAVRSTSRPRSARHSYHMRFWPRRSAACPQGGTTPRGTIREDTRNAEAFRYACGQRSSGLCYYLVVRIHLTRSMEWSMGRSVLNFED